MRTRPISSLASSSALPHARPRCTLMGSATCMPTVRAGLSDDIGSWKIMAILLPRMARMPASSSLKRSWPSKIASPVSILPGGVGIRRMSDSAVTLLPEPELADDRDGLAGADVERHLIDGRDLPALRLEARRQVADLQEGLEPWGAEPAAGGALPRRCRPELLSSPSSSSAPGRPRCAHRSDRADRAGTQLAVVVLHPRPPGACRCRASAARCRAPCRGSRASSP